LEPLGVELHRVAELIQAHSERPGDNRRVTPDARQWVVLDEGDLHQRRFERLEAQPRNAQRGGQFPAHGLQHVHQLPGA
jgi:hypothetical protein